MSLLPTHDYCGLSEPHEPHEWSILPKWIIRFKCLGIRPVDKAKGDDKIEA